MKTIWIEQRNNRRVLVFFNGWGMDEQIARYIHSSTPGTFEYDVLACHDYHDLLLPEEDRQRLAAYDERVVVAWSFGVYAALNSGLEHVGRAIALNGTPYPVSCSEGIAPEIFQATLDNWSEDGRERFMRRISGGRDLACRLAAVGLRRSIDEQKSELSALQRSLTDSSSQAEPGWLYSHAVIGARDMIFSPDAQKRAWRDLPLTVVETMPHVPFFHLKGWNEVMACSS
ncbi:MAG: DUF452 domain-containing protein [Prosthecochloris sp.]|uniref:DUF452 family protein n=1 Tax=Prosthecochloris sp. TaxID=290513 RepID=UPI0013C80325|nr:pimeloyl-ACP methyl esterase BioG family protein [Prosthecochloris sp.]NEX11287.1 DUF452 domain-containing protein [Prosthecochloris sp.]